MQNQEMMNSPSQPLTRQQVQYYFNVWRRDQLQARLQVEMMTTRKRLSLRTAVEQLKKQMFILSSRRSSAAQFSDWIKLEIRYYQYKKKNPNTAPQEVLEAAMPSQYNNCLFFIIGFSILFIACVFGLISVVTLDKITGQIVGQKALNTTRITYCQINNNSIIKITTQAEVQCLQKGFYAVFSTQGYILAIISLAICCISMVVLIIINFQYVIQTLYRVFDKLCACCAKIGQAFVQIGRFCCH